MNHGLGRDAGPGPGRRVFNSLLIGARPAWVDLAFSPYGTIQRPFPS